MPFGAVEIQQYLALTIFKNATTILRSFNRIADCESNPINYISVGIIHKVQVCLGGQHISSACQASLLQKIHSFIT